MASSDPQLVRSLSLSVCLIEMPETWHKCHMWQVEMQGSCCCCCLWQHLMIPARTQLNELQIGICIAPTCGMWHVTSQYFAEDNRTNRSSAQLQLQQIIRCILMDKWRLAPHSSSQEEQRRQGRASSAATQQKQSRKRKRRKWKWRRKQGSRSAANEKENIICLLSVVVVLVVIACTGKLK